eukprot:m.86390 g.86390  ORF g.86390 m.86390 type:complete len:861 (+) comp11455_c0_seq2:217-2799(+)
MGMIRSFLRALAGTYVTLMVLQYTLVGFDFEMDANEALPSSRDHRSPHLDGDEEDPASIGDAHRGSRHTNSRQPDGQTPERDQFVEDVATPCGQPVPFGEVTIRHPRRPGMDFERHARVPTLMVSFESDRLFSSPLHGQTFDSESTIFIFLDGPIAELQGAEVRFELDQREPWLSSTGVPFDLFGLSGKGRGPDGTPLNTNTLSVGCRRLSAIVKYLDGTTSSVHAQFEITNRPQKVWLITTVSVDDAPLLGFFLDNYLEAGVPPENFVIIVHAHTTEETTAIQSTVGLLRRNHIGYIHTWEGDFNTFDKFEMQESLGRRFVQQQDWVLHPDVDEHHRYPGRDLLSYLQRCNERGVTAVIGDMQDRVAEGGVLAKVEFDNSLGSQFPLSCLVTKSIVGGATTKVVLHRGFLIAEEGGYHTLFEWKHTYGRKHKQVVLPPVSVTVAHFKWTSTVAEKLRRRENEFKKQGIRWWVQSARLRMFLSASQGVIDVTSASLKCVKADGGVSEKDAWPRVHMTRLAMPHAHSFTVILMAYSSSRQNNQKVLLRHFANMHFVHEVVFIWNGAPSELPSIPRGSLRPIRVRQERQNSLNNRWNHTIYPQTDGVLMVDDDQFIPLNSVLSLFARWQHEPDRVIGVVGRNFIRPATTNTTGHNDIKYVYPKDCCSIYERVISSRDTMKPCDDKQTAASWCDDAALHGGSLTMDAFCDTQRMVLPKGMFFHKKYLRLYSHWTHKKLRSYVNSQEAHCDDVAFNFLVANETGLPGVVLDEDVTELVGSSSGLFNGSSTASKTARLDFRTECVAWIADYFGGRGPPPFRLEPAGFHLRLEHTHRNPVVFASRRYSVMWNLLNKCIAENGQRPR